MVFLYRCPAPSAGPAGGVCRDDPWVGEDEKHAGGAAQDQQGLPAGGGVVIQTVHFSSFTFW